MLAQTIFLLCDIMLFKNILHIQFKWMRDVPPGEHIEHFSCIQCNTNIIPSAGV